MADIINQWIIPVLLAGIYIILLLNRKHIMSWAKKQKKVENYAFLLDGLKVNIGDWKKTILMPIILIVILDIAIILLLAAPPVKYDPLWFATITSGLANPISEEFLTRGILLSLFMFTVWKLNMSGYRKYAIYVTGIILTTAVFAISHENITLFQWTIRSASSVLLCLLYLTNERNLLPPIIAHAAGNWFLIGRGGF